MNFSVPEGFRGAVSVSRGGEVLFEKAYGFRDLANEIPNTPDTRFETASAGKAFVGAAVMKLVEEGKLSLDSRLVDVMKFETGPIDPAVTIKQLLSHTSGVADYFDEEFMEDYAELWVDFPCYRIRKSSDLLFMMLDKPMKFRPGEKFSYNNGGFLLLDLVIESVTGMPFDRYLQKAVFDPCGMSRTGYYEMDRLPGGCANSYIWDEARREYYTNIFSVDTKGTGAGGAFTTVQDARAFWEGLYGWKIVSCETLDLMTQFHARWDDGGYGLGLWLDEEGCPLFQGGDPGVEFVSRRLRDGTIVTAVSNFGDSAWKATDELIKCIEKADA